MQKCPSHSTSPKKTLPTKPSSHASLFLILVGITPSTHGINLRAIHDIPTWNSVVSFSLSLPIQSVKSCPFLTLNSSQINLSLFILVIAVKTLPALKSSSQITPQLEKHPIPLEYKLHEDRTWCQFCSLLHPAYQAQCPTFGWHSGNVWWMNQRFATAYRTQSGVLPLVHKALHSLGLGHSSPCSLCSTMGVLEDMFCLSLWACPHPSSLPECCALPCLAPATDYLLPAN